MEGFVDWAERHALLFGLCREEIQTLLAWRELFARAEFSESELQEATTFLAMHPDTMLAGEARFAGKMVMHLCAIQGRVRHRRREAAVKARRDAEMAERLEVRTIDPENLTMIRALAASAREARLAKEKRDKRLRSAETKRIASQGKDHAERMNAVAEQFRRMAT